MRILSSTQTMYITEVSSLQQERIFLEMPSLIYKKEPNYVRPLDKDITDVFDSQTNPLLAQGGCCRLLLWTEAGTCIGRIAAFYKVKTGSEGHRRIGGIGFFECINDQEAADLLFDQAKRWLAGEGISVIHGPVNFGSRHKWWGLLAEGDAAPNYGCHYHPPYYRQLFENYGFSLNYRQLTFSFNQGDTQPRLFKQILSHYSADNRYEFKPVISCFQPETAAIFQQLYNNTWAIQEGLPDISLDQVLTLMQKLEDILDPRLIWFAYFKGEPVAFFVGIAELNSLIVQHVWGKIGFLDKFKLASRRWFGQYDKAFGLYYGVLPAFQRSSVGLGLMAAMQDAWLTRMKIPYRSIEFNWIGDYNPRMVKLMQIAGAEICKVHHTYRLWI